VRNDEFTAGAQLLNCGLPHSLYPRGRKESKPQAQKSKALRACKNKACEAGGSCARRAVLSIGTKIRPLYPARSMPAATFSLSFILLPPSSPVGCCSLFIYCLYSLEPVGYGRYRKEISINKSSKTDMRKQARKPDKGNPPPGCRLPQSRS